jgi:DNA-binding transcriptional ArsR family regulator
MNVTADARAARIAAAIGEAARARMLFSLSDGLARTSTELAAIAGVTPSTASVHLQRLKDHALVNVVAQGKHRYYTLGGPQVAAALEALSVVAASTSSGHAGARSALTPTTPPYLRAARTCYDHIAGALGVRLHDRFVASGWLKAIAADATSYDVTPSGIAVFASVGIDVDAVRGRRRRFAFSCLDWSERRAHLGGGLAAAILDVALRRRWIAREPDSRVLSVAASGRREMARRFGVTLDAG